MAFVLIVLKELVKILEVYEISEDDFDLCEEYINDYISDEEQRIGLAGKLLIDESEISFKQNLFDFISKEKTKVVKLIDVNNEYKRLVRVVEDVCGDILQIIPGSDEANLETREEVIKKSME